MKARQQERVHESRATGRGSKCRDRARLGGELIVGQQVRKDGLGADLPVHVEGVLDAELVGFLRLELTEQQLAIAEQGGGITEPPECASCRLHVRTENQKIGIGPSSEMWSRIHLICEGGSLEQDWIDTLSRERREGILGLPSPQELTRRVRATLLGQRLAH
jgi:hypothetical protein